MDAFIVADVYLLSILREINLGAEIHVSTIGTAFNSKTIEFYKTFGASRIALPKELTYAELKDISEKSSGIDLEVFILSGLCKNVEGFCMLDEFNALRRQLSGVEYSKIFRFFQNSKCREYFMSLFDKLPSSICQLIIKNSIMR